MIVCAAAMLHQPRVPPTGQRQAIEIQIKWREVLAQKQALLDILSKTTGNSVEKLDKVRVPLHSTRIAEVTRIRSVRNRPVNSASDDCKCCKQGVDNISSAS